jgi:hypothetical protein
MLKIINLKEHNAISVQTEGDRSLIASSNGFVVSIATLAHLINYLVQNGIMSPKVLEGILEEFNTE